MEYLPDIRRLILENRLYSHVNHCKPHLMNNLLNGFLMMVPLKVLLRKEVGIL